MNTEDNLSLAQCQCGAWCQVRNDSNQKIHCARCRRTFTSDSIQEYKRSDIAEKPKISFWRNGWRAYFFI